MELVNKINEKDLYAARAVADQSGNNIVDTYAQKTEIPDVSNLVTQQELSTELNTKQDNLSTEQLYNIDNAVTSLAGVMAENKLTIESGKITEYDGTPFAGGSSDIVHFDYNNGNPELSWSEITAYMDTGKQIIIYDRTVAADGKTKLGYVSNYDKVNNFIQFTNISNMTVEGETVNGINWAYVGNSLGWQRTFIRNGGEGGKTYEGVAPVIVDNVNDTISVDTIDVNYQQIVHDDSLVHVSNDAQYALGVNVPYLKWLMGVDETVIFENPNGIDSANPGQLTIGTSYNLTEPFENFDRIRVYTHDRYNNTTDIVEWFPTPNRVLATYIVKPWFLHTDGVIYVRMLRIVRDPNATTFKIAKYNTIEMSQAATSTVKNTATADGTSVLCISRIVGVHRKVWNGGN